MRPKVPVVLAALAPALLYGQATPKQLEPVLAKPILAPGVVEYQLKSYLSTRIPRLTPPATQQEWITASERIRKHLLDGVIFHGWPAGWVRSPLRYEEAGLIESGRGYRIRKLRYEIVPGSWTTALLYEPEHISGKVPAILNLNGHGRQGKAVEYKQKRCINYALKGMLALSVEWLGCGELAQDGNNHDFGAQLDLAGANAAGMFYLEMRKALDYLYQDSRTDRGRIAVTGLSGGGWQTIVLSALDPRVAVAIPVAGYGSLASNIVHPKDTSQIEEDATDFRAGQDYTHLTAMRAPRPTLLIYNAEDNCCFRAPVVKDDLFTAIRPFFALFGAAQALDWHENLDPGTHNYQLDNRLQSYRFLKQQFHLEAPADEIPVEGEVKTAEELTVGLPANNLTMLDLARRFAADIHRKVLPASAAREKLVSVVRYRPVNVTRAWLAGNSKNKGLETESWDLGFSNGLSASAVLSKSLSVAENAPVTILIGDQGKEALAAQTSERVNRGEQVLAVDILFTGDSRPPKPADYALLLASSGDRPIGMEAAQLLAVTKWLLQRTRGRRGRLEIAGMRMQLAALIAAAIEPGAFSELVVSDGIQTLQHLLEAPVKYRTAPDVFCLDLLKEFDLDMLSKLAAPARVTLAGRPAFRLRATVGR